MVVEFKWVEKGSGHNQNRSGRPNDATRKDAKNWWSKVVLDEYYREKMIPISEGEARRLGEFLPIEVSVERKKP
jgi:hypothetical protein